jgi:hypothetical protein
VRIKTARESGYTPRGPDRRVRNVSLHFPERRLGFDRRRPPGNTWRGRYYRLLERYRGDSDTIAAALLVFVVLNIADLLLTIRALSLGAVEVNPVMAWLFDLDPALAAMFKLAVGLAIALAVWAARRYRKILETSLLLVAVMTMVLLYHGYNVLV